MWQAVLILILGAFIALIGWLIGRFFSTGLRAESLGLAEFEWLLEDLPPRLAGVEKANPYNRRLHKYVRRALRRIPPEVGRGRPGMKISLSVRSIGKWTFSTPPGGVDDHYARSHENRGLAFLRTNQTVIQPFMWGDAGGLRLRLQPAGAIAGNCRTGTYALEFLTLDNLAANKRRSVRPDTDWLAAHMAAHLASRQKEWRTTLLEVINKLLPDCETGNDALSARAGMDQGAFEQLYLSGWLFAELGCEIHDRRWLERAVPIYRRLIAIGFAKRGHIEAVLIIANAAKAMLASYELSGRNPERLLEADEYCQLALARCNKYAEPVLICDLHHLGAQIHRLLAAHDGSLQGLRRADEFLQCGEAIGRETGAGDWQGLLMLEAARIAMARAEISGNTGALRQAKNDFDAALKEFRTEGGFGTDIEAEARLGLAECLIRLGIVEARSEMLRRAVEITRNTCQGVREHSYPRLTARQHLVQRQLDLSHVKALGAFGGMRGEVAHLDEALSAIRKLPEHTYPASRPLNSRSDIEVIRAGILVDRCHLTKRRDHYRDAVDGTRALRAQWARSMSSVDQDIPEEWYGIYAGLVRALYQLARHDGRRVTLRRALDEACLLRELAKSNRNPRHLAEAEAMLADILTLKSDVISAEGADALSAAVSATRRALDLTPRQLMPAMWAKRQSQLGGLLSKYSEMTGDVAGLETAISAFEKSLGAGENEPAIGDRAATLFELGQTLVTLAARTGDRSHEMRAQAVFDQACDTGTIQQLHIRTRLAAPNLTRLSRVKN